MQEEVDKSNQPIEVKSDKGVFIESLTDESAQNIPSESDDHKPQDSINSTDVPVNSEEISASDPKILSESEDLSNDSKTADEASDQAEPSRHRQGELFQRTMVALSRSEVFTSFLKSKIDETRSQLNPAKKDKQAPTETKRKRTSTNSNATTSKRRKLGDGASQSTEKSDRQPKLLEGAVLRDYQMDGLDWLMALDVSGASGILADEMGLGKTIQVIALISFLIEVGSAEGPFLVLGPLSTVPNWMNEFKRFAPKIPVVVFYGTKECRKGLRNELQREHIVDGMRTYPVIITSYNIPLKDQVLRRISWRYVIVDEGHRLKNHNCKLIQELRRYRTVNRLLLTGTPLQNNLTELWSLLNFVMPDIIDDQYVFESWFDEEELSADGGKKILEAERKNQVLTTLHRILKPFVLRRVKADVDLNLPPKRELIVYAPLTPMQKELYTFIVSRAVELLKTWGKEKEDVTEMNIIEGRRRRGRPLKFGQSEDVSFFEESKIPSDSVSAAVSKVLKDHFGADEELITIVKDCNPFMSLRRICQHPYLLSFPVMPGTTIMPIDERIVSSSGKLLVMDALLKRLKSGGHKVLIFSTFTSMLDIIQDYLEMRRYKFSRLDGTRDLADRKLNIDSFNEEADVFAFLISTRAGGLGINLVSADTVIIFDSDFNPQVDLQAQDRCHRIGQTKPVVVYRLVVDGTIDEQVIERADTKMRLVQLVISHGKFKSIAKDIDLSAQELESLLTFKDRHKLDWSKGEVLSSAELDMLCDRKALFDENALSQDGVFKIVKGDQKKSVLTEKNTAYE